ncbi:MAG: radical SAM protein [Oscillospiraceae bacterium]|nr:radical SAM protein [Oscillospiraceae bacterium]
MQTIPAKTIVMKVKKPSYWFGAEYNMNIYRGCSHGCIYCDSRSDCYRNTDFDTVKAKENALEIIRNDLRRKVKSGVISTGAMSDPYNPQEREHRLTRNALELVNAYEFGIDICTKSALVTRDVDILRDIKRHSPVLAKLTITAAEDALAQKIEPHVSSTSERFAALETLANNGIYCGVLLMPLLPYINDTEENILKILEKAKDAGAGFVYPSFGMTLRAGNREYYYEKLDELFPGLKQQYIKKYGDRYECRSPKARKLYEVFAAKCNELGLLHDMRAITRAYKMGYEESQLTMF